jgi:hypothetical protein
MIGARLAIAAAQRALSAGGLDKGRTARTERVI